MLKLFLDGARSLASSLLNGRLPLNRLLNGTTSIVATLFSWRRAAVNNRLLTNLEAATKIVETMNALGPSVVKIAKYVLTVVGCIYNFVCMARAGEEFEVNDNARDNRYRATRRDDDSAGG